MKDSDPLICPMDLELATEATGQEQALAERRQLSRERCLRLHVFDSVARHVLELLKTRLAVFLKRFQPVFQVAPRVGEDIWAVTLMFTTTGARVTLLFEVFPDQDVSHARLECTQDIIPVCVPYVKHLVLECPLISLQDDVLLQRFDERIVTFVRLFLARVGQDVALQETLEEHLVEDPVTKIRFSKYLAASTLERDGQTFFFLDEDTRREFDTDLVMKE